MNTNPQNNFQLQEEEGIDIKKYIFLILSHWWWFAIAIFVSLTIAYLINRYTQEVYSTSCSIIVGEPESRVGSAESLLDELSRVRNKKRKAVVENEISILKSYILARKAIEELDFGITYAALGRRNIATEQLYTACPFMVIPTENKMNQKGRQIQIIILSNSQYRLILEENVTKELNFGDEFSDGNFNFKIVKRLSGVNIINPQSSNKYVFNFNDINQQALSYSRNLGVQVNDEKGSILSLSSQGFVPAKVSDFLNKLSEVYIRSNLEEKNITSENTINFIDDQLKGVVDSLQVTGIRLQNFRSKNKVLDLSKEGGFLFNQLQGLQEEKSFLEIRQTYYNYLFEYIDKKTDYTNVISPSVVNIQDPLLNSLVTQLNNLGLKRNRLSLSVNSSSPQLNLVDADILGTKNALKENLKNLSAGNLLSAQKLQERIIKIELEVKKLPATERQLIDIQREFTINDQIYTFLLQKRAEAGITRASNTSDHKILDIARPENANKIRPNTTTNYMLAFTLAGVAPLVLLLLLDFFNTKITDRKYLEANLMVPIIGNIGHCEENSDLPVNEKPRSSLAESFRSVRTNLEYILKEENAKVISVSSAISGEGKTFTSINLATIIAMAGKKTLLVSLDLRRPKVHKIFNLENNIGMSTYLIGKNSFDEILCHSNINNLSVTTSGPIPPNPAELIGSGKMVEFISEAKKQYDYIVLDTPPIAIVTDTLALKDLIEAFIFVIRHNYSDKQVIDLVNNLYNQKIINRMGVVVNDIIIRGYYGYTYRYGYGYGYNYSYNEGYYGESEENNSLLKRLFKYK